MPARAFLLNLHRRCLVGSGPDGLVEVLAVWGRVVVVEVVGRYWIAAKGDRATSAVVRSKDQWRWSCWTAHLLNRMEGVEGVMVDAGLSLAGPSSSHHYQPWDG